MTYLGIIIGGSVNHTKGKDAKNDDEDDVDDELAKGRTNETLNKAINQSRWLFLFVSK